MIFNCFVVVVSLTHHIIYKKNFFTSAKLNLPVHCTESVICKGRIKKIHVKKFFSFLVKLIICYFTECSSQTKCLLWCWLNVVQRQGGWVSGAMNVEGAEDVDQYISQLRDVFESCDIYDQGYLSRSELLALCHKLQLEEQAEDIVDHLIDNAECDQVRRCGPHSRPIL